MSANEQARVEMQTFLYALKSYPNSFAKNPRLSFEEFCGSLTARRELPRSGQQGIALASFTR